MNPYNVGIALMREIMRLATEPDDEERERWSWAGETDPFEQVRTVLRDYDDEGLLREFLTPKVCEECRLYARFEHLPRDPRRIRVSSREADAVRERSSSRSTPPSASRAWRSVDADSAAAASCCSRTATTASGWPRVRVRDARAGGEPVGEAVYGGDRQGPRRGHADVVHRAPGRACQEHAACPA